MNIESKLLVNIQVSKNTIFRIEDEIIELQPEMLLLLHIKQQELSSIKLEEPVPLTLILHKKAQLNQLEEFQKVKLLCEVPTESVELFIKLFFGENQPVICKLICSEFVEGMTDLLISPYSYRESIKYSDDVRDRLQYIFDNFSHS
ncbi:MAG TPA: hypothetical protein ENH67_20285 [Pseudoalteromonas sp.]|uniref:Uncharacterized protein n=1 Tax=marine sediment metagenome TaxID=412755 RepID=A0A0F9PUG1_9ZZZZ|nr:hypothetical protein [Pseudoalteromonas sp.]HDY92793.1 hypothetical protein [Pseudoalteromonas sp.]HDZ35162.1 hypothetical protein [Pseudoalteromonas sp.]